MPTVDEIKRDYGEQQIRLVNECFELAASAQMAESDLATKSSPPPVTRIVGRRKIESERGGRT